MAFLKVGESKPKSIDRLYLMQLEIELGESRHIVYKIGKASGKDSSSRMMQIVGSYFSTYRVTPRIKILRDSVCTDVFKRETEIHTQLSHIKFYPEKSFSGSTELFDGDIAEILETYTTVLSLDLTSGNIVLKTCTKCKTEKPTSMFHNRKESKDGLNSSCRECMLSSQRSIERLPTRMYGNMVSHSKARKHPAPTFTAPEFKNWLKNSLLYKELYYNYRESGFNKDLVPSIDRKDTKLGYTFNNIRICTFRENYLRERAAIRDGIATNNSVQCKAVWKIDLRTGTILEEFHSRKQAARSVGANSKNIDRAVDSIGQQGFLSACAGFGWITVGNTNRIDTTGRVSSKYLKVRDPVDLTCPGM